MNRNKEHTIVMYKGTAWLYNTSDEDALVQKYKDEHPNFKIVICNNHEILEVAFHEIELQSKLKEVS